jgi:hypothetical protein
MGEDGAIHSEQGDWYDYVEHISKLEISMTNPYLSVENEKR